MKRLLFIISTVSVVMAAWFLWEGWQLRKENVRLVEFAHSQRNEIDSLHIELAWALDAANGSEKAKAHLRARY